MEKRINLAALLAAGAAVCRIIIVCYACGTLYTFGVFYMAVLCGIYCITKKALFLQEAFFSVWVRGVLALLFTGSQVLGLYYSVPGMEEKVHVLELILWTLCLTPLTYGAQNMLFGWVKRRAKNAGETCCGPRSMAGMTDSSGAFSFRRDFLAAYAVILAGFLIPFATYYPAIMAYDVIPQLDQIKISGYTTHHPLVHTLMLSVSLKIGELLPFANADRAGLAVYTVVQMLFVAGCFAYVYAFLRKKGVHKYVCYLFVLCAALYPTHGMLAVSITKDTIYGALVMVFTVFVWELVHRAEDAGRGWFCAYTALTVLLLLFRNNSIYAWGVFLIVESIVLFKDRCRCGSGQQRVGRNVIAAHAAALGLYLLLNAGMTAASHATNTTYAREMLSVPAQQIARVTAFHGEELTQQDKERLGAVWGKDNLPEYVPAIADRSKRDIPNDPDAIKAFAGEWFSLGLRYPGEYVKAFLLKNKGMWYLEDSTYLNDVYSYAKGYLQITYPSDQQEYMEALVPGYARHGRLQFMQAVYRYFAGGDEVWRFLPPLSLIMQPAFYCWLLMYYCICCIGLKRKRMLIPAVYTLALTGTLVLAPCVLVRYLYPVMLSVPVLALLLFNALEE